MPSSGQCTHAERAREGVKGRAAPGDTPGDTCACRHAGDQSGRSRDRRDRSSPIRLVCRPLSQRATTTTSSSPSPGRLREHPPAPGPAARSGVRRRGVARRCVGGNRDEFEHGMTSGLDGKVRLRRVLGRAELGAGLGRDSHIALQDGTGLVRSDLADRVVVRGAAVAQPDSPIFAGVPDPAHGAVRSDEPTGPTLLDRDHRSGVWLTGSPVAGRQQLDRPDPRARAG